MRAMEPERAAHVERDGVRLHYELFGTGAIVTGVLDVRDITTLHYWVGCSGYTFGGAG